MAIRDLITRDTKIIHLVNQANDFVFVARKTGLSEQLCESYNSWYLHDGIWYYYKRFYNLDNGLSDEIMFINELIGEILANKLEVPVVHYMIAELRNTIGLISQNFHQNGQDYYFMKNLQILSSFYDDRNIANLRRFCKDDDNYRELICEVLKLVAIDLYMNQQDRNFSNIQFTRRNGELHLTPLYDFEESFDDPLEEYYHSALLGIAVEDLERYPQLNQFLDILFASTIRTVLEQIEDERKILIPQGIKDRYSDFERNRRIALKR